MGTWRIFDSQILLSQKADINNQVLWQWVTKFYRTSREKADVEMTWDVDLQGCPERADFTNYTEENNKS